MYFIKMNNVRDTTNHYINRTFKERLSLLEIEAADLYFRITFLPRIVFIQQVYESRC